MLKTMKYKKTHDFQFLLWKTEQIHTALTYFLEHQKLPLFTAQPQSSQKIPENNIEILNSWIKILCTNAGLETECVSAYIYELEKYLASENCSIFLCHVETNANFLFKVKGNSRNVWILTPKGIIQKYSTKEILHFLIVRYLDSEHPELIPLFEQILPSEVLHENILKIINQLPIQVADYTIWNLNLDPGLSLVKQLKYSSIIKSTFLIGIVFILRTCLLIYGWYILGHYLLNSSFYFGIISLWILVVTTEFGLSSYAKFLENNITLKFTQLIKLKAFTNLLRTHPGTILKIGTGNILQMYFNLSALENGSVIILALLIMGIFDTIATIGIILTLPFGWVLSIYFLIYTALFIYGGINETKKLKAYNASYSELINVFVETMRGHLTRLVQMPYSQWHIEEDILSQKVIEKRQAHTNVVSFNEVILSAKNWILSVLVYILILLYTNQINQSICMLAIGGMLLGLKALEELERSSMTIAKFISTIDQTSYLLKTQPNIIQTNPNFFLIQDFISQVEKRRKGTILQINNLAYHHEDRNEPIIENCSLRIRYGDRVLLQGESGSGKSTLVSLLTALRTPKQGILLLHGLDINTIGEYQWRKKIALASQFHENHLFPGTLAFNLLLGKTWPPTPEDLLEAETICYELGLGTLLDRMPEKLYQIVGTGGWTLSHGERTRIFLARTLLQKADLVILDESLAALDPQTMNLCFECIKKRTASVLIIAHH